MEPDVVNKNKKPRKEDKPADGASTEDDQTPEKSESYKENLMKPHILTGTSDFQEICQTQIFVDRTASLEHFLFGNRTFVVTAPPCMGKSTMLSMVHTFMAKDPKSIGKVEEELEKKANYKYFQHLAIAKNEKFMKEHLGKYPVINVSFSSYPILSAPDAIDAIKYAIHRAYVKNEYLKNVLKTDKNAPHRYVNTIDLWLNEAIRNSNTNMIFNGLKHLAEILNYVYKQQCWVLVDGYDSITNDALDFVNNRDLRRICKFVISSIFSVFECNEAKKYVFGGIVTGTSYNITGFGLSRELDDFEHYRLLGNHPIGDFFRLYDEDVSVLLKRYDLENEKKKVSQYYNGYVGEDGKHFYNSNSVFKYIRYRNFEERWKTNIVFAKAILHIPTLRLKIELLLLGEPLKFQYMKQIDEPNFKKLVHLISDIEPKDPNMMDGMDDVMLTYLLEHGYFSIKKTEGLLYEVFVPNKEVSNVLERTLKKFYGESRLINIRECNMCINHLIAIAEYYNDPIYVKEYLNNFFETFYYTLIYNNGKPDSTNIDKSFCQRIIVGIFSIMNSKRQTKKTDLASTIEDLSIVIKLTVNEKNPLEGGQQSDDQKYLGVVLEHSFLGHTKRCLVLAVQFSYPKNSEASCGVHYSFRNVPECFKSLDNLTYGTREFSEELQKLKNENPEFLSVDLGNMESLDLLRFNWFSK